MDYGYAFWFVLVPGIPTAIVLFRLMKNVKNRTVGDEFFVKIRGQWVRRRE